VARKDWRGRKAYIHSLAKTDIGELTKADSREHR
jgi:hypothetical protein